MTRPYTVLSWTAAAVTYLLIVLGAVVRITGSGMGCGDHWPLCNGRLVPPLDDLGTIIEWSHRLVAALVSVLVAALAGYAWWLRRRGAGSREQGAPGVAPYLALGILVIQVLLGAVTVKLELPAWSVILHLGAAMMLLATLLVAASSPGPLSTPSSPPVPLSFRRGGTMVLISLTFVTVLFGALTANLGAAAACGGFPLCNGEILPSAGPLAQVHWTHRLLAYALTIGAVAWAVRRPRPVAWALVGLVVVQVALGAVTVLTGLPPGLQAAHLAVGTAVWAGVVLSAR